MPNLTIILGASAKPLVRQLKGRLPKEQLVFLDGLSQTISKLRFHRLLSPSEAERARRRLCKAIELQLNRVG